MSSLLQEVSELVQEHMDEILKCFKPGAKITVLVRSPDHPTRDFMMTSDNVDELMEMLVRRKADMGGKS